MRRPLAAWLNVSLLLFLSVPLVASTEGDSRYGVVHGDKMQFLVEGGFGWTRMDFVWNGIEPENDTFRFEHLDRFVENCSQAGVQVLAILDYSADWASSGPEKAVIRDRYPPKYLSDWEDYVRHTVEHFKGVVDHFEVWNEPNIRYFWFGGEDPKEYFRLLRSTYLTAKEANPECTILIGGTIGFDIEYLREVYEQGGSHYFDAMAIHPYMGSSYEAGNFSGNMSRLKDLMSGYGDSGKEIWFTEMGWSTSDNFSKMDQAAYLVRAYTLSLSQGADKLFWFNLNADPPPRGSSGLIEHDLTPRPAFIAHRTFVDFVGEGEYRGEVEMDGGIEAHIFRHGDSATMVVWHPNLTAGTSLRLSGDSNATVYDMLGRRADQQVSGRRLSLEASPEPLFVVGLSEDDLSSISGSPLWPIYGILILGLAASAGFLYTRLGRGDIGDAEKGAKRRRRPRRARERDVPEGCTKSFKEEVCLKCRHYTIKGGKPTCMKFGIELE